MRFKIVPFLLMIACFSCLSFMQDGKKKIVFFGCQQIGVDFIDFLLTREDIEISLIVTYELPMDKTYGYKSVLEEATKRGLKVINPNRITESLIQEIKEINAYVIFSIYYRKIFHRELLKIPEIGCINIHPSLLPEYRGPVPTAWALMNGEKFFGITIHHMDEGMDTGPLLSQKTIEIFPNDTYTTLSERITKIGSIFLIETLQAYVSRVIKPIEQDNDKATVTTLLDRKDGEIDWKMTDEEIDHLVRAYTPWPGCYTIIQHGGKPLRVKILKAKLQEKGFLQIVPSSEFGMSSCSRAVLPSWE